MRKLVLYLLLAVYLVGAEFALDSAIDSGAIRRPSVIVIIVAWPIAVLGVAIDDVVRRPLLKPQGDGL